MRFLMCTILGFSLFGSLNAWERTAKQDCEKNKKQCQADADRACTSSSDQNQCRKMKDDCKTQYDQCEKKIKQNDENSFSNALGPFDKTNFNSLSSDDKTKAMDYADKNKMSPSDAVEKVMSGKN